RARSPSNDARLCRRVLADRREHYFQRPAQQRHRVVHHGRGLAGLSTLAQMEGQMSAQGRVQSSAYVLWAKTRAQARFNLASSGLVNFPRAELDVRLADI